MADAIKSASPFDLIPGYREAVAEESEIRDLSVLMMRIVCGFEVNSLTPRLYLFLQAAGSPFLTGEVPRLEHLAQFIWCISTSFRMNALPCGGIYSRARSQNSRTGQPWSIASGICANHSKTRQRDTPKHTRERRRALGSWQWPRNSPGNSDGHTARLSTCLSS